MNSVAASPMSPQTDIHSSRVLILDFGAQYTQLIARRVRELGVYCEILPWDISNDDVRKWKPRGIILSGGPESVTDKEPPRAPCAAATRHRSVSSLRPAAPAVDGIASAPCDSW